ncbi:MAG: hypothetical protein ACRBK7_12670 [Acidimicrobiales bacterium]
MKLPDEDGFGLEDSDTLRRVRAHADAVDRSLPELSGAEIRQNATMAVLSTGGARGRGPFLAAAAALVIVGGAVVFAFGRSNNTSELQAATPAQAVDANAVDANTEDVETADVDTGGAEPEPEVAPAEPDEDLSETEGEPSPPRSFPDLRPIPVAAADFGAAELRYLPTTDSGFVVASGSRMLLSEAELGPELARPVRIQRVSLPATDPADRRGIVMVMSTYASQAEADALIEAEPTTHGSGEPADITGLAGAWKEVEGFAPHSAGNPMRVIRTLRVRLNAETVLDVAAADVSRTEIEGLVSSLVISEEGLLETPTPPVGFDSAEPVTARSLIDQESVSDYLSLGLVGGNSERVSLDISADLDGLTAADAHFESAAGYGWIEAGLFGETVVSFVGPDVALRLVNYDGQVTVDELVALAAAIEPVDDETWAEQLAIAQLFDAPVAAIPSDD